MSFKNIIKCFLCISLLVATPAQEANAQVGQAVKSATKTVSKWFGKKAAKETAEEVAEQGFKTISKEIAQKAITKNATNAIFDSSTKLSREALEEVTYTNINKTLSKKVGKEITEGALKITSKEFAQQLGKVPAREAQEIFLKKLGTEATQETYEQTAKKSLKEAGEKNVAKKKAARTAARITGADALKALDDMPQLKKQIKEIQDMSPAYFTTDKLYVETVGNTRIVGFEGTRSKIKVLPNKTIRAEGGAIVKDGKTIGEMNEFLNNPLPNTRYETEGGLLNFQTDELGRTVSVDCHSSELNKSISKQGISRSDKLHTGNKGSNAYNSGHIQQRSTGGLNERINLLPMNAKENQHGKWARIEGKERKAINAGKDVRSRKIIKYNDDGSYAITVELTIDGKTTTEVFKNLS